MATRTGEEAAVSEPTLDQLGETFRPQRRQQEHAPDSDQQKQQAQQGLVEMMLVLCERDRGEQKRTEFADRRGPHDVPAQIRA